MRYQKDEGLLNLLEGKRVAIVGPSPHLVGKGVGELIDEYDLVCRVNEVHATGYEKDYGDRTDVIFHNCGSRFIDKFGERLCAKARVSRYIKYVVCPCVKAVGADNNWNTWSDNHVSVVVENFKKINVFNIPFHWIGMKNYRQIYDQFGCEPNSGQVAILMLLEHGVKELLITGFSFYAQGDHPHQSHRHGHTNQGLENELIGNPSHPQAPQVYFFRDTVLKKYKEQIKIDSFLDKLLGVDYHSVLDLEA